MFKVYMEKEIKGASKMNAEELLQALLKDVDGEEWFREYTPEDIKKEIDTGFLTISDDDIVKMEYEEMQSEKRMYSMRQGV